jgi:uncharacterized protein YbjT (DUF2867 family)
LEKAIPMVATRDIGIAAARLLVEGGSSKPVIELVGPREYSPRGVAAALGRAVGRPIVAHEEPEHAMAAALMGTGMNAAWARLSRSLPTASTRVASPGRAALARVHGALQSAARSPGEAEPY